MAKKVKENNEVSAVRRSKHGGVLTVFFSLLIRFLSVSDFSGADQFLQEKRIYHKKCHLHCRMERSFTGLSNFIRGIEKTNFFQAFGYSVLITVGSVAVIILCTSMCAWYITRVHNKVNATIYMLCLFSMIVPFQMVMFTLSKTGKYDASEQPGRYHFSIPWIRCRTCGVYVLRLCKKYSDRDRRGGDDRWMYSDPDILSGGISNYETNGDHRCNFTGNVDLERLFTSLSGIGYQKIQDDSNRHSVLKRWLWSSRLGYDDGNACTCNCSNCSFLCGLSEIYY